MQRVGQWPITTRCAGKLGSCRCALPAGQRPALPTRPATALHLGAMAARKAEGRAASPLDGEPSRLHFGTGDPSGKVCPVLLAIWSAGGAVTGGAPADLPERVDPGRSAASSPPMEGSAMGRNRSSRTVVPPDQTKSGPAFMLDTRPDKMNAGAREKIPEQEPDLRP